MKLLLDKGAIVNARDECHSTALYAALATQVLLDYCCVMVLIPTCKANVA